MNVYLRFKAIAQRSNLKLLIHESTMDIFRKYTNELEQVQAIYEANKVSHTYLESKQMHCISYYVHTYIYKILCSINCIFCT